MILSHPALFAIGLTVAIIAALFQLKRRSHSWLILFGLLLIATAAGGPVVTLHPSKKITAMIDLSPSTRGSAYRDRSTLLHRISDLAGNIPVQMLAFSDHIDGLPTSIPLPDLPCEQTQYDPPAADAILLFSDGRFNLPDAGPPTYPIIDPLLIDPPDASVMEMHFDGNTTTATLDNHSGPRQLIWSGTSQSKPITIANGSSIIHGDSATGAIVEARLNHDDLWPENDSLTLPAQPPAKLAKWWIGTGSPSADWTVLSPANLPSDPTEYLTAGLIALSNVSAEELSDSQQQRLTQYVRDLGGTLLIFSGDHAFSAGGYSGTTLDSLSPLASDPPSPATHWMLLVDSSGSMAESSNGRALWSTAVEALLRLLPSLPSKDIVSVGSFARDLSWWIDSQPADIAKRMTAPPPNIGPNGPTNLQSVLTQIAHRTDSMPCELLLLTDAQTTIDDPQSLADALKAAKVRVSLLALGNVSPDNPIVQIVTATGGHWSASADPSRWIDSLRELMQSAAPSHLQNTKLKLQFDPSLDLPARSLDSWNRTWIKNGATQIASADDANQPLPLAAQWRIGVGSVAAFAFTPTMDESNHLANKLAQPPRDPRFKVTWQCDTQIRVSVDTSTPTGYLNNLHFALNLGDQAPLQLHQTAPGTYSLDIPAIRAPSLATLQLDGHVIDRRAIPGRYAPEFDAIGNDDVALSELAARTGGQVIAPSQHTPIAFAWPAQHVRIDSYLAAAGALLLAIGIIRLRSTSPTPF